MSDDTFVYVTFIKTTPEKLWEALTSTEFIKQYWFGSSFETDWQVGSTIKEIHEHGEPGFQGVILRSDPPRLLSYTFNVPGEPDSEVSFRIETHQNTVTLTVTHKGFKRGSGPYKSTSAGWAAILSGLKSLLETGEPLENESIWNLYEKVKELS